MCTLRSILGAALGLAAAASAAPIEPEDVAAARAAQARDGYPERLQPLVTTIQDDRAFEEFIQLHKPSLGKVLFFTKLAKSELCDSLAEHFDGQLDVLHIPPSATDVAAKFQIEELPAVFVLPTQTLSEGTLQLVKYDGNFKFGGATDSTAAHTFFVRMKKNPSERWIWTVLAAFDRIVEFLDEFGARSGCVESSLVRATDPYFIRDHAHVSVQLLRFQSCLQFQAKQSSKNSAAGHGRVLSCCCRVMARSIRPT